MEENFFDDLGPEISQLADLLIDPFMESFFLKGEPDYHLGTCLKRCPETLQELIAEEYGMELKSGKVRKRQLELLEQKIMEELPGRIEVMQVEEFKLLLKLAIGEGDIAEAAGGLNLQKRGWVFYYVDSTDQNTIPVFPDVILKEIKKLTGNREFIMRMAYFRMFRNYISTLIRLYGVFEKNWLFTIIEKHGKLEEEAAGEGAIEEEAAGEEATGEGATEEEAADEAEVHEEKTGGPGAVSGEKMTMVPDMMQIENLIELLKESLDRLQKESNDFVVEEDYIFSYDLEEDGDYKDRFHAVKEKEYYEPGPDDIRFYSEKYIDDRSREYRILRRYLEKKFDNSLELDHLMEELSIEAVEELGGMFSVTEIMERYKCAFSSVEDLNEFERLFRNWEDQLRKWNNRGFTNVEMQARGENGSSVKIDWDLAAMEFKGNSPAPDAPCPCGSGKKYRQCCGRGRK